jgi:hypothetical protein
MGTNYYLTQNVCQHCGRGDEQKHIGKSSAGWVFALHVYPEEGIHDLPDWVKLLTDSKETIKNEYGDVLTLAELLDVIKNRSGNWSDQKKPALYASAEVFHQFNHSMEGPSGLVRAKIDKTRVIKHGDGTWDCMIGYFS